jgi:hypothetical protein
MPGEADLKNKTLVAIKSTVQSRIAPEIKSPFFIIQIIGLLMSGYSGKAQTQKFPVKKQ